ncbi:tellurite resistance/C4-dicarboxylate transporter family protein [Nocardia transvalensis]|uniref:tellurite resistance/C4-dicarboxylate transporter family protein n=1 Tax=Nocardia transvalensis TaxID=37333 RepID=UPI00189579F2|nr:tellurite resistance/C4-dicarboxylate transporter family protein [Nocardia transvalensis]MBF6333873.1 tellurite resistance/C4-dicarboxylate transporter family protein [Nocardia transvalensis]
MGSKWVAAVQRLKPGWFAAVMATGIVARAVSGAGWGWGGDVLLGVEIVAFAALVVGALLRVVLYWGSVVADARNPATGFTFLTFVAAAAVLSAGAAKHGWSTAALILLAVAAMAWLPLCYLIPAALMVHHAPRTAVTGADGTWFLWVVGTQSLAVAATALPEPWGRRLAVPALLCWSVGIVLYGVVAALVLGTLFGGPLTAAKLVPPYWIFMGATAISVLAAAQLLAHDATTLITQLRPFIAGAALTLWAFGSWLIPLLLAAGVWRHLIQHVTLDYEPALWSIVFPLGMYGVGTKELGGVLGEHWMVAFGRDEAWIALAAWAVTAIILVLSAFRRSRLTTPRP